MNEKTSMMERTAEELCREYLDALEHRDIDRVIGLLAPDAVSEFPYAPVGIQSIYTSAEDVKGFIALVIDRLLESVTIRDLEITVVDDRVAFAEFRSDCRTKKGLEYQNRYIVRVAAASDRITLWREYFDPRATDTVK